MIWGFVGLGALVALAEVALLYFLIRGKVDENARPQDAVGQLLYSGPFGVVFLILGITLIVVGFL